jgi:hypothetical protein
VFVQRYQTSTTVEIVASDRSCASDFAVSPPVYAFERCEAWLDRCGLGDRVAGSDGIHQAGWRQRIAVNAPGAIFVILGRSTALVEVN